MIFFSILGALLTLLVIVGFIYVLLKIRSASKSFKANNNFWVSVLVAIGKAVDEKIEENKKLKPQTPVDLKRESFKQGGLKTFYLLDKGQIDDLYPQIYSDLELKRIETNSANTNGMEIGVKAPELLTIKANDKLKDELKAVYEKGEKSISTKYTLIENYFANHTHLRFGLEDIPDVEKGIAEFKQKCSELINRYKYEITEQQQEEHIKKFMRDGAQKYILKLSRANGYFALQIDVRVTELNDEFYILSYNHPVNQFLFPEDKKFQLNLKCSKKHFSDNGLNSMTKDKLFNITTLAKISNWDENSNTLELSPIAIY